MFQGVTECEVFLHGTRIYDKKDPRIEKRHYTHIDVSQHASVLRKGKNVIAVRANRDKDLRSVDAGLYTLIE